MRFALFEVRARFEKEHTADVIGESLLHSGLSRIEVCMPGECNEPRDF
jgi:hypothetical protein